MALVIPEVCNPSLTPRSPFRSLLATLGPTIAYARPEERCSMVDPLQCLAVRLLPSPVTA
jgi:hypothetical protein